MSHWLHFRLVDAFAEKPFMGNPAGVVLDAEGLDERQMQLIARDVNASETSFVFNGGAEQSPLRIRWFTPTVEVGFCGHATLAAAHAVAEAQGLDAFTAGRPLVFDCGAGPLRLTVEASGDAAPVWWLEMPDPGLRPDNTNPMRTCELLGMTVDDLMPGAPQVRTRDNDMLLFVSSWQRLTELKPAMSELREWSERHGLRGILVATTDTLSRFANVASRFFAPAAGINEDPVTGSVHGPLAITLVKSGLAPLRDGSASLNCIQGPPGGRAGLVRVVVRETPQGLRATVGGACHTVCRGEMRRP